MEPNEGRYIPTPKDRAKIFSAKSRRQAARIFARVIYFTIVALVLAAMLFLLAKLFFSVEDIIVNMTVYESQNYDVNTVKDISGVSEGDVLFFADKKKIEENIKTNLPFVDSVSVKKEFPNTVTINIVEEKESFYFEYADRYFVISSDLKVLAFFDSVDALVSADYYDSIMRVELDEVKEVEVTKTVVFFDSEAHRRSEKVLSAVESSPLYGKISSFDMSELYDLKFVYDSRIDVYFGSHIDFEKKLENVEKIIAMQPSGVKGYIYIYNADEAHVSLS